MKPTIPPYQPWALTEHRQFSEMSPFSSRFQHTSSKYHVITLNWLLILIFVFAYLIRCFLLTYVYFMLIMLSCVVYTAKTVRVVLSVCLSVRASSSTTGCEAANERHQRVVNDDKIDTSRRMHGIFGERERVHNDSSARAILQLEP